MEERSTTSPGGSTHALQCPPSTSSDSTHRISPLTTVHTTNSTSQTHKLSSSAASPTGSATSNITSSSIAAPSPSILNNIPPPLDRERLVDTPSSSGAPSPSITPSNRTQSSFVSIISGLRSQKSSPAPALSRAKILSSLYANVPTRHKLIHVHTLTSENLPIAVESKCQVWDIFHCCCVHLAIEDDRFFGLAIRSPSEGIGGDKPRHEYFFLQFDQKISKCLPKQSRFSKSTSVDKHRPALVLYLRVRVYIERIDMIQCNFALHHYYKQLRENLLDHWSGSNSVSEERCWELAALALQADKSEETDEASYYFRAELYFPLWVINQRGLDYLRKNMPKVLNSENSRLSQHDAKVHFCQEASRSPFALNCHLYGLRRHKADVIDNALIGITDKGIDMWDVGQDGERIPLRNLAWNRMARLSFDKKRLSIGGLDGSKISLYAQTDEKSRYLLNFCKEVHQQLLQINLHFAMTRPPSTRTLPPGWRNEVSVDGYGQLRCPLKNFEQNSIDSSNFSTTSGLICDKPSVDLEKSSTGTGRDSLQIPGSKTTSTASIPVSTTSKVSTPKQSLAGQIQIPSKIDTKKKSSIKQEPSPTEPNGVNNSEITRMLEFARSPPKLPLGHLGTSEVGPEPDHEPATTRKTPSVSTIEDIASIRPAPLQPLQPLPLIQAREAPARERFYYEAVVPNSINEGYGPSTSQAAVAAMKRAHFGPSKTFDENLILPSIEESPYSSVLVSSGASRSLHDLRTINAIKQPPVYDSSHQIIRQPYYQPQIYAQPMLQPHPGGNGRSQRWQTCAGDDQLEEWIRKMRMAQEIQDMHNFPPHQYPLMYPSHLTKSEPRLDQTTQMDPQKSIEMQRYLKEMVRQKEMAAMAQEHQPKTKRRYASRSPARGAINRVKSMPSHSALLVNDLNVTGRYHEEPQVQSANYRNTNNLAYASSIPQPQTQQARPMVGLQPTIPTTTPSNNNIQPMVQKEPPSYQEAMVRLNPTQAQQQPQQPPPPKAPTPPNGMNPMLSVNTQKNNIAKKVSLDRSMPDSMINYPMMSQLLPELLSNNGLPSSSSSDDTIGAPIIPPKDYESPHYDTPPEEIQENGSPPMGANDMQMGPIGPDWFNIQQQRQVPQYFPQPYPVNIALPPATYDIRYGPPPPPITSQPMRTMASASPPSPPFYYKNAPMAGFMPLSGSPNRGEYIFQHNLAANGPYAQYTLNTLQTPPNSGRPQMGMDSRQSLFNQIPPNQQMIIQQHQQQQPQPALGVQLPPPPPYPQTPPTRKVYV